MRLSEYQERFANMFTGNDRAFMTNAAALAGDTHLRGTVSQTVVDSMEHAI